MLQADRSNKACLDLVDHALFIVCLDDAAPDNLADLCNNFLCGTYNVQAGEQVGTCTNRWYDKVRDDSFPYRLACLPTLHSSKSSYVQTARRVSTSSILASMDILFCAMQRTSLLTD